MLTWRETHQDIYIALVTFFSYFVDDDLCNLKTLIPWRYTMCGNMSPIYILSRANIDWRAELIVTLNRPLSISLKHTPDCTVLPTHARGWVNHEKSLWGWYTRWNFYKQGIIINLQNCSRSFGKYHLCNAADVVVVRYNHRCIGFFSVLIGFLFKIYFTWTRKLLHVLSVQSGIHAIL